MAWLMRLVGYVRVSLESEDPGNQRFAIIEYCAKNGHQLIDVYEDIGISGATKPLDRPGFSKAIEALRSGMADGLIVAALDRIARSLVEFFVVYKMFSENNWALISVREDWLNNLDPKIKPLIASVLSWAAEMEREFIRERTREALARLKAEGKRIGRPPKWTPEVRRRLIDLVRRGISLRDACRLVGIGYTTAVRHLSHDPEYLEAIKQARLLRLMEGRH